MNETFQTFKTVPIQISLHTEDAEAIKTIRSEKREET